MSKDNAEDFKRRLRRLDFAVRSKPAEKRGFGQPDGLVSGSHARGYLPHVKALGATYFITFRLADSLPNDVLKRLRKKPEQPIDRRRKVVRRCGFPRMILSAGESRCILMQVTGNAG